MSTRRTRKRSTEPKAKKPLSLWQQYARESLEEEPWNVAQGRYGSRRDWFNARIKIAKDRYNTNYPSGYRKPRAQRPRKPRAPRSSEPKADNPLSLWQQYARESLQEEPWSVGQGRYGSRRDWFNARIKIAKDRYNTNYPGGNRRQRPRKPRKEREERGLKVKRPLTVWQQYVQSAMREVPFRGSGFPTWRDWLRDRARAAKQRYDIDFPRETRSRKRTANPFKAGYRERDDFLAFIKERKARGEKFSREQLKEEYRRFAQNAGKIVKARAYKSKRRFNLPDADISSPVYYGSAPPPAGKKPRKTRSDKGRRKNTLPSAPRNPINAISSAPLPPRPPRHLTPRNTKPRTRKPRERKPRRAPKVLADVSYAYDPVYAPTRPSRLNPQTYKALTIDPSYVTSSSRPIVPSSKRGVRGGRARGAPKFVITAARN